MASGSGNGGKSRIKRSTNASKRRNKQKSGKWVTDKSGRTGHWEGASIYDDLPF